MPKQQTINKAVSLKGVGLHTGKEVNLTFKPAEDNFGFKALMYLNQKKSESINKKYIGRFSSSVIDHINKLEKKLENYLQLEK